MLAPHLLRRLWLQLPIVFCGLLALAAVVRAQDGASTARLELELGGELSVGIGHHCHPPSEPSDDTIECGSSLFLPGASFAALLHPNTRLGLGVTAAAGRSQFADTESTLWLYRVALEGRVQLQQRAAGGFYAGLQLGMAWLAPIDRRSDNGPLVGLSFGHAWSPSTRGFGVALTLNGALAFFGDYETSRIAHYGTLGFVTLSLRLNYGLPL